MRKRGKKPRKCETKRKKRTQKKMNYEKGQEREREGGGRRMQEKREKAIKHVCVFERERETDRQRQR